MTTEPDRLRESTPRWSIERRLNFIASRLNWERRINRADLVARFGISPNQATADLRRFATLHPGALVYDTRTKIYRAGPGWNRPDAADAVVLLRDLRLVAEGVLPADEIALVHAPALGLAEPPVRAVPPAILSAVVTAIRDRRALNVVYQSFSAPEPRRRLLEPHALVFDGFRWHARAWDADEERFRDFVLGRMSEPMDSSPAAVESDQDVEWQTSVTLEIAPHPGLLAPQRAAVEADYGMVDGRLFLTCRQAMLYYVRRRLGLMADHQQRSPQDQQIILTGIN